MLTYFGGHLAGTLYNDPENKQKKQMLDQCWTNICWPTTDLTLCECIVFSI